MACSIVERDERLKGACICLPCDWRKSIEGEPMRSTDLILYTPSVSQSHVQVLSQHRAEIASFISARLNRFLSECKQLGLDVVPEYFPCFYLLSS